jgi:hypothetical protein
MECSDLLLFTGDPGFNQAYPRKSITRERISEPSSISATDAITAVVA